MSEYGELIKNYNLIREYMRDFYVYGFRSREDYTGKSLRSYDNERRRIESYLNELVEFRQEPDGKKVFMTTDASELFCNPFYKSLKTKSFTDNDINLHFSIIYVLKKHGKQTLSEIEYNIYADVMNFFKIYSVIDTATLRNKLKEYSQLGIIKEEKEKSKNVYSIIDINNIDELFEAVCFFSENFPLGVIGSFILDRSGGKNRIFTSKHKYLLDAADSEIIFELLSAIKMKETVEIESYSYRKKKIAKKIILPLKIAITMQSGRNYVICLIIKDNRLISIRLDNIKSLKRTGETAQNFYYVKDELEKKLSHTWGVYVDNSAKLENLQMYLRIEEKEQYIIDRIKKEGRFGNLEKVSENFYCYSIEAYDMEEIRPWLRTFIGKIEKLECSVPNYAANFYADIEMMKKNYGGKI